MQYIDEMLVLKELAKEQEMIAAHVEMQDQNFEKLLQEYEGGQLSAYQDGQSLIDQFGEPTLIRSRKHKGQDQEVWLYRYATDYFQSPKIYFYFDNASQIMEWTYKNPEE